MPTITAKAFEWSSLSDSEGYPEFCLAASNSDRLFRSFRRNPVYNRVLDHVSEALGREYLQQIELSPSILENIDKFKENDRVGRPRTFYYETIGRASPTTLRYVKVLADLKRWFTSLDGFEICEIGGGYGGQCRVITSYFTPRAYCLVDIESALMLTRRFLANFVTSTAFLSKTIHELESRSYDLLISNYAFTELPRYIQDVYLEKAILNSKRGYITYNEITPPEFNSYRKEELVSILPSARIADEVPLTHPRNCIIVWGNQ